MKYMWSGKARRDKSVQSLSVFFPLFFFVAMDCVVQHVGAKKKKKKSQKQKQKLVRLGNLCARRWYADAGRN